MNTNHLELESLSAYLDGELSGRELSQVEDHLHSCADCKAVSAQLAAASGRLAALPAPRMTVDEHRELRQAVLSARPVRTPWHRRYLSWAVAGSLAVVAFTAFGLAFLRDGTEERGASDSSLEAAAPQGGSGDFEFSSGEEVDETVASLPEVAAGLNRYRPEDAPERRVSALARTDPESGGEPPGAPAPAADPESAGGSAAVGAGGAQGGDGGGSLQQEDSAAISDPFSNEAADACLTRVASSQSQPMVPLLARPANFRGTPAWLLVFAWSPEPALGQTLGHWQTWVITPEDCLYSPASDLENRALHRSFSAPT